MTEGQTPPSEPSLSEKLSSLLPLIRKEWPALAPQELEAAKENVEQMVALIATHTDRTKTAIRRQLAELASLLDREGSQTQERVERAKRAARDQLEEVLDAVHRLENFATSEAKRVSDKVLPMAETRVRQNLWTSLIVTFALGIIFGLWMTRGKGRSQ